MGGQACILYGAAEFSRDLDLLVGLDAGNVERLQEALRRLEAKVVFLPGLDVDALARGHACHFRCHAAGAEGLRIDVMAALRGCPDYEVLWRRKSVVRLPEIGEIGLLALADLVQAKKTQREKDWPMIRRLIEADFLQYRADPQADRIRFWLKECRTPEILVQLSTEHVGLYNEMAGQRPLLRHAREKDMDALESSLEEEEAREKENDREFWLPLKRELDEWRREYRNKKGDE